MPSFSLPAAGEVALDAGAADAAAGTAGAIGADAAGAGLADAALPTAADIGSLGAGIGGDSAALGTAAMSPLDALMGGITAGASDSAPLAADIGGDSAIAGVGDTGANIAGSGAGFLGGADAGAPLVDGSAEALTSGSGVAPGASAVAGGTTAPASSSWLSQLGASAAKNPLNAALAGSSVLSGIQSLIPRKQVNIQQNAADVLATNPSFSNPNLPQYTMQNTATPYSGNWYTYGQKPETAMYNAQPIPVNNANAAKKGGLIGYARGGQVRGYADGGTINATYLPANQYMQQGNEYVPIDQSLQDGGHTLTPQEYLDEMAFEGNANSGSNSAPPVTPATAPAPPIGPAPAVNMNNIAPASGATPQSTPPVPQQQSVNPLQMINQPQGIQQGGQQQGGQMPMRPQGMGGGQGASNFAQIFGPIAQAVAQNQGTGHARGGMIRKFAMGGPVPGQAPMSMPAPPMGGQPPQMPPQGISAPPPRPPMQPQQAMPQRKPVNPLALNMAAHKIGMAIGKHMKQRGMTPDGRVKGHGGGQDDIVPARLSKDEFVIPADVTAALGDGSSEAGGKKLLGLMDNVRKHKTGSTKYPPKAKNPLAYLPKGKS